MQERTSLEDALGGIGKVERELEDNIGMIELGEAENDTGVVAEAETALKNLKKEVARRELEALLSGEADRFDSYLEVHAGAGGTESQDWAEMLLRMYTRWAEKHGFKIEYLEETQGEEAGIKSATIQISGHNAYGWLKTAAGLHRLVRASPVNCHLSPPPSARAPPPARPPTRRSPRCGSRTFRPGLRWSARLAGRSTRTRRRPGTC